MRLAPRQHVAAGDLNYSEQRSLEIGMTLASRPRVILLDEPMAGMSQHEVDYTVELIKDVTRDCTLLIVEHDMQVVFSLADRISVLVYGEILATGTPAEIRGDARVREAYLGRKPYEPARHPFPPPPGEQQRAQREGRRDERANRGTAQPSGRARPLRQEPHPAWHRPGHRPRRSHQPAGRNGAGRSTTMKSIMGLVDDRRADPHRRARHHQQAPLRDRPRGLGFVPEEREVFANLTVDENLRMGEQPRRADAPFWTVEQMFDYFPRLKERRGTRAGNLSGGEQQMLTMCRSLLGNPKVMLIDEPTEGLAPKIVEVIADVIRDIHQRGVSVVLVEQKLTIALKVSTRVSVMGHGRIVFEGPPAELQQRQDVVQEWLAV